jgi:hypothetical protein
LPNSGAGHKPASGTIDRPARAVQRKETIMLLDVRTYTVRPGTLRAHLQMYEEYGLPAQKRHLGEPFAYLTTETGDVNTFLHIWLYQDATDRARRRAAMQADPDWVSYLRRSAEAGYLVSQHNQLMLPASFAPITRPAA